MHGGDIYRNRVNIDFSINSNPFGMPESVKNALQESIVNCGSYPDIRNEKLLAAIAAKNGVNKEHILCGNGASELFMAIVHGLLPKKIMIPVPSFFGYEYAAAASDSEILFYEMKEEEGFNLNREFLAFLKRGIDILFLANPNNPTGNLIAPAFLEAVLKVCKKLDIIVVLDECFLEFVEGEGELSLKLSINKWPNLIVVRSFTKIFAIPGVRLGYLLCAEEVLLQKIKRQLPEWNLSSFAQAAGVNACGEKDYIAYTAAFVKREREYMTGKLQQMGIKVFPSEADYLLFYSEYPLYEKLLERGILIRDCSNFRGLGKGFYRAAVRTAEENRCLLKEIEKQKGCG